MNPQIIKFGLVLFGAIIAIAAAYHWIVQISYEKPRKSTITPELEDKFYPLLFKPKRSKLTRFLTKLNILT